MTDYFNSPKTHIRVFGRAGAYPCPAVAYDERLLLFLGRNGIQLDGVLHGNGAGDVAQDVAAGGTHVAQGVDADVHAHDTGGQARDGG